MIIDVECGLCSGAGRLHTVNGDPDDEGETCGRCEGTGVVEHNLNDDADD